MKDKFQKDFEKWFYKNLTLKYTFDLKTWFSVLPESMRYGPMIDFFDSVGIEIRLIYVYMGKWRITIEEDNEEKDYHKKHEFKEGYNRDKARKQAINKAKEIYNKRI